MDNQLLRLKKKKMTKSKNTPKLRFPEFTEEWEEKKLGEICLLIKDGTHGSHKDVEKGVYLLSAKDINRGKICIAPDSRIISQDEFNKIHKSYEIKNGDILITIVGTIGEIAIVKNYDKSYTFQRSVGIVRTNENSGFMSQKFQTASFKKELKKRTNFSAQGGIYLGELSKIKIKSPISKEQGKIYKFLTAIDGKINLLEDKLNFFKDFKKFCMQQLFAHKLRFKNAKGEEYPDWEEKKLKHLVIIPKKEKLCSVENKILLKVKLHCKGIETNENLKPKITKRGRPYYERNTDEILIGRQNFHNGGFGIVSEELNGGIASNAITSLVTKNIIKNNFLLYYFSRSDFYKRTEILIGGTGQKELSQNELLKIKIKVPQLEEQEKIANFLLNIDNKIDKITIELTNMKEFKKGLLQQMFI